MRLKKLQRLLTQSNDSYTPSPVETFQFRGVEYFIKRDDLLDPCLSGNKFRKLYTLLQTPPDGIRTLVSYGGLQSNAMVSLACLCRQKGWAFHYYTKPLPGYLKTYPTGNYKAALELGMRLTEIPLERYEQKVVELNALEDEAVFVVRQGGADPTAEPGIEQLGIEIDEFIRTRSETSWNIVIPSGTGTTAYYLAKYLPLSTIFTTAVVGDEAYLKQQMQQLGDIPFNLRILKSAKKYHFAKPYREFLNMHQELTEAGVLFDMIYAPKMWLVLLENGINSNVLYVHSGGISGNETMLERYRHKKML